MALKAYSLSERRDLEDDFGRLAEEGWPRFLRQRDALGVGRLWPALFTDWSAFQVVLYDDGGEVAGVAHSVPFAWDGSPADLPDSIAGILERADGDSRQGRAPTALSALAALVDRRWRGKGLSRRLVEHLRLVAGQRRLRALVAPVRPTLKERYPLTPMERYVNWQNRDGLPLDPWIRVHAGLGATIVRVAPRTLIITGTVAEWERWTDMAFPDTGLYVVPGALQPVAIDRERDEGRYEDPNVWMHHPIEGAR